MAIRKSLLNMRWPLILVVQVLSDLWHQTDITVPQGIITLCIIAVAPSSRMVISKRFSQATVFLETGTYSTSLANRSARPCGGGWAAEDTLFFFLAIWLLLANFGLAKNALIVHFSIKNKKSYLGLRYFKTWRHLLLGNLWDWVGYFTFQRPATLVPISHQSCHVYKKTQKLFLNGFLNNFLLINIANATIHSPPKVAVAKGPPGNPCLSVTS